jgi:hypothetical protein
VALAVLALVRGLAHNRGFHRSLKNTAVRVALAAVREGKNNLLAVPLHRGGGEFLTLYFMASQPCPYFV